MPETTFSSISNVLSYNLSDFFKPKEFAFLNVNKDLYEQRINFLLEKLPLHENNDALMEEILNRLRLRILKLPTFALNQEDIKACEILLDNLNRVINFQNHIITVENLTSFLILKIAVLLRLQQFEKNHSLFLQNILSRSYKVDVMIALMPIINNGFYLKEIVDEATASINTHIPHSEDKIIKWMWTFTGQVCTVDDGKTLFYQLLDSLSQNPNKFTLLSIEGLCKNKIFLNEINNHALITILSAANFEPRIKVAKKIINSLELNFQYLFTPIYMPFLIDELDDMQNRKYALLFFEDLSKSSPQIFNNINRFSNKLFSLLENDLYREEYKIALSILINLAKYHPQIERKIDNYTKQKLLMRPTIRQLDFILQQPEFLPKNHIENFINLLLRIMEPENFIDELYISFYKHDYQKKALEVVVKLVETSLKKSQNWSRNPVDIILNNLNKEASILRVVCANALTTFALKQPSLFNSEHFNFILEKTFRHYQNVLPALAILIKQNESFRAQVTSELLTKLIEMYIGIGFYFDNAKRIEKPILTILHYKPEVLNISHIELLSNNITRFRSYKILEYLVVALMQKNVEVSDIKLRNIEDCLNFLFTETWNKEQVKKTISILVESNIFPAERLASFFIFHLGSTNLINKYLGLVGLSKLLFKQNKNFINQHEIYLQKIIEKLDDENNYIKILACTTLCHFTFNNLVRQHFFALDNQHIALIKDTLDTIPDSCSQGEIEIIENSNIKKITEAEIFSILQETIETTPNINKSNINIDNVYEIYHAIKPDCTIHTTKSRDSFFSNGAKRQDAGKNGYNPLEEEFDTIYFTQKRNRLV